MMLMKKQKNSRYRWEPVKKIKAGGGVHGGGRPSFLPSCLPAFLPSFLPSCLPSFLPSCLPSFLPAFLPSFLPAFLPSFLPSFLPFLLYGHLFFLMHLYFFWCIFIFFWCIFIFFDASPNDDDGTKRKKNNKNKKLKNLKKKKKKKAKAESNYLVVALNPLQDTPIQITQWGSSWKRHPHVLHCILGTDSAQCDRPKADKPCKPHQHRSSCRAMVCKRSPPQHVTVGFRGSKLCAPSTHIHTLSHLYQCTITPSFCSLESLGAAMRKANVSEAHGKHHHPGNSPHCTLNTAPGRCDALVRDRSCTLSLVKGDIRRRGRHGRWWGSSLPWFHELIHFQTE